MPVPRSTSLCLLPPLPQRAADATHAPDRLTIETAKQGAGSSDPTGELGERLFLGSPGSTLQTALKPGSTRSSSMSLSIARMRQNVAFSKARA